MPVRGSGAKTSTNRKDKQRLIIKIKNGEKKSKLFEEWNKGQREVQYRLRRMQVGIAEDGDTSCPTQIWPT